MPTIRVNLDVNQYVRVTSDPFITLSLLLQSHRDTVRIVFSDAKPAISNMVFHELGGEYPPLDIPMTEVAVWALAMTDRSALTVTEQRLPVEISDRDTIGQAVFIQDQTTAPLSVPFLQDRNELTIAVDTVVGDYTFEVLTGGGAMVGEILELSKLGGPEFMQATILSIVVDSPNDTLELDQKINNIYLTTDVCQTAEGNLLVDGSITPQIFTILPLPGQVGDIVRVILLIRGSADMDYSSFGSDVALTRGCLLRVNKGDGTFRNLFNFKSNGDFALQAYDAVFELPKQGNSTRGFSARVTYGGQGNHGVIIRLDGNLGETLELIVQDSLAGGSNIDFRMIVQGHEPQE